MHPSREGKQHNLLEESLSLSEGWVYCMKKYWSSPKFNRIAFIDEYLMQLKSGGVLSSNPNLPTYNKIWSPGKGYFGDLLYK